MKKASFSSWEIFLRLVGFGLAACFFLTLPAPLARAASFTVTKLTDSADGVCNSDCSLREAITAANATSAADTITLGTGTYVLTLAGTGEDANATGDLDITEPLTISGQGMNATLIDAQGIDRVFDIRGDAGDAMSFSALNITNGTSPNNGGGVSCSGAILSMTNVSINNSTAPNQGGGLFIVPGCSLNMTSGEIASNTSASGGGVYLSGTQVELTGTRVEGNTSSGWGGGIYSSSAELTILTSSLTNNSAAGRGGALYQAGASSMLEIVDSLISYNFAGTDGGGLCLLEGTSASILNSTIAQNRADQVGGGLNSRIPISVSHSTIAGNVADDDDNDSGVGGGVALNQAAAVLTMTHTLLANNVDRYDEAGNDCVLSVGASVVSAGYNLVRTVGSCAFAAAGDITGVDPLLDSLNDYGGLTETMQLLAGSPAIDAGDPAYGGALASDQRGTGFDRVVNGRIDIGAFERGIYYAVFLPFAVAGG